MTEAKIIADSLGPSGVRLTTFVLTFPRFILPEFNTHRMFSRNASSSRAIPVSKQIAQVMQNPFVPASFNKNAPGMQGGEPVDSFLQEKARTEWLKARDLAVDSANELLKIGISKQYVNRLIEPFAWTSVVCTATEYANFFALRYHEMAQPEICELAKKMYEAFESNVPKSLKAQEWHLPFIRDEDWGINSEMYAKLNEINFLDLNIKRSVARCARVSYLNHDGTQSSIEQDLQLYHRLVGSAPIHASPTEHQAMALEDSNIRSGNLRGFIQFRQTLPSQNIDKFNGPL